MSPRAVTVIGIGDDGCLGLTSRAAGVVASAQVLVGGERHLEFFPQFKGERLVIKKGIDATLKRVAELANEQNVCVLASGDPLFFGIAKRVIDAVGATHVDVIPAPSSVQWAFAKTGLSWEDATILSVHGTSMDGLVNRMRSSAKVAILTDNENSPARIAARLIEFNDGAWDAWVCERLGGPEERVRPFTLPELAASTDIAPLNVLVVRRNDPAWCEPPRIPFLHEDEFAKRMPKQGLITKREVRLLSLAALQIRPTSIIWDIGAASGSIAIEAAMLAPRGAAYAIEIDEESVGYCRDNVRTHGTDNVHVIHGRAPEALEALPKPDAVFVGGSKGSMVPIVTAALAALRPGGRVVVNAITLENVAEGYAALKSQGLAPEVTLVQIARGAPLAHYQRYEALNPIHIMAATKPAEGT